ncbi:hypothetical protein V5O48_011474 [Marasmius crinis-equi]|uniref:Glutamine amidotransferase type-2 domain-containing protein n=1 Tax=Marasmius crinis-equi TaxID=585013 RepID=A0ABR3F5U7_9AGAR
MCGISAIYATGLSQLFSSAKTNDELESKLRASIEAMIHRGPDSSGIYVDSSEEQVVGLAHARLSIIDLEGGHQPLHNNEDSIHAVVNGELYDYAQLREHLESKGCIFKSSVDSELIIHLYEVYGLDLFQHLRGEFAFALYDQKRQILFAARDRAGIKPLYYTFSDEGKTLMIGSEMKALRPLGWSPEWDVESIVQMGDFNDNRTVFKGIHKLPPGNFLSFTQTGQFKIEPYWDHTYPNPSQPETRTVEEMIEGVRERLVDAVRARLRSDVPLGVYLSGGIDSAVVAGIAAKLLKERNPDAKLSTFTLSFPDRAELDEGPIAKRMADFIGAEQHLVIPSEADLVNHFEQSVYHVEGPVHTMHGAGKLLLSEYVHERGFKVILTGEGSDEIFAGYSFYLWDYLRAVDNASVNLGTPLPSLSDLGRIMVERQAGKLPQDHLSISDLAPANPDLLGGIMLPRLWGATGLSKEAFSQEVLEKFGAPDYPSIIAAGLKPEVREKVEKGEWHPVNMSTYTVVKTILPNFILNLIGERVEMANSVEGRPPFLDHRLVEYANGLPPSIKMMPALKNDPTPPFSTQFRSWEFTEKWVLRQAAKPFVTDEIFSRAKSQYNAPIAKPSKASPLTPLQIYLKGKLTEDSVKKLGWASWEYVGGLLKGYLEDPQCPTDGGIDRRARALLCMSSFVILQERFDVPAAGVC